MRHVLAIQHVENRMQNKLNACNIRRGKIKPRRKYLSFFINQARFQILARFCKNKQQIQNLTFINLSENVYFNKDWPNISGATLS